METLALVVNPFLFGTVKIYGSAAVGCGANWTASVGKGLTQDVFSTSISSWIVAVTTVLPAQVIPVTEK